ncbi:flagellar motor stator protein MotA [Legionella israelensis]|uniref:flagellar motor stator protein MotA n=1 Tax=Legionella israelensis TaxID=454 RepID=UPI00117F11F2|nr:flagellar motor stator protein MotA [Legionella israelensis]QDP73470.1 flagellar motor stator protein MotA [Legionella israelensis]
MLVLIGYIITLFSVFGGFALAGGHLHALFQPIELLMIGGAAIGSFLVSNNWKIVKLTMVNVIRTVRSFGYTRSYYTQLLSFLFEIADKVKKEGALSIESDINHPHESEIVSKYPLIGKDKEVMEFFCDHMQFILTGRLDGHNLDALMEQDIETFTEEKEQYIHAINKLADGMPAFGIVAAVMGVVHTMGSLGIPPEELGALIARALVGTFLGVLIGYGFVAPLAVLLEHKRNASIKALNCIRVVLVAMVNNYSPSMSTEFGRKTIYGSDRMNGKELEEMLKGIKQANKGVS